MTAYREPPAVVTRVLNPTMRFLVRRLGLAWEPRGGSIAGLARAVDSAAPGRAEAALREKYRLGLGLFHLFGKDEIGRVTLEVRPADTEGAWSL